MAYSRLLPKKGVGVVPDDAIFWPVFLHSDSERKNHDWLELDTLIFFYKNFFYKNVEFLKF